MNVLRLALSVLDARLDPDNPNLAATRVELARALLAAHPTERAEAHALLARARDTYAALGPAFAPERATGERLLADN